MTQWLAKSLRNLHIVLDIVLVSAAWLLSYVVRFKLLPHAQEDMFGIFAFWLGPLLVLSLYFHLKNGLYDLKHLPSLTSDIMQLLRANAITVVTFIVCLYFFSEGRISRLTIAIYILLSTILLIAGRLVVRSALRKLRRRGYLVQDVIVAGNAKQIHDYLEMVRYTPGTGLKVRAVFTDESLSDEWRSLVQPLSAVGTAVAALKPDLVVLAFENESSPWIGDFIRAHYDQLIQIQVLVGSQRTLLGMTTEIVGDLRILSLNRPNFSIAELAGKRLMDIVGALVALILFSPVFLIAAIAVRLSSKGPIFYGQERVGMSGRTFKMWKFRSMKVTVASEQPGWTVENDPRRTRVGTFLRKTSIDELPQLWNVLVGDMSLVGPRPEQPFYVDSFRKEIPAYMLRHKMKAGITGWAQVNGWRGDTSLYKRIECDLFYIKNWTLWLDVKILFLTVVRGFINKNAY